MAGRRLSRRALLVGGVLVAVVGGGYAASYLLYGDRIPAGVHVGGADLSGMSAERARTVVQRELADDAARPLTLLAGDVALSLSPLASGLRVDVEATVDEARSAGPLDRLRGLFGSRRDVTPVAKVDEPALTATLTTLAKQVDRPAKEASITFLGAAPVPVPPQSGLTLPVGKALRAVVEAYPTKEFVDLPVEEKPVRSTDETVEQALREIARPAVAAPVRLAVAGKTLVVTPRDIAAGLSFTVDEEGALVSSLDGAKVLAALGDRVDAVAVEPVDATFVIKGGVPVVVPSKEGKTIPPAGLATALEAVLRAPAPRTGTVDVAPAAPRVTTEQAKGLGITEVIGTFTTRHPCCRPRVTNIHTIADVVDGYVVLPGESFDLNAVVGKRDRGRGFVAAPQILKGQFVDDVGGGVSQFATTMFNAVFFSGLEDVAHKPHSYYISRYPPGREATVSFPKPDLIWRNDSPQGVLVLTSYTSTSITVTFWGKKRYEISSVSGPRTRIKPFGKEYVDRPDCTSSSGAEGFDIVVTRVFSQGGKVVRRQQFRTRYLPEPNFICGKAPSGQPAKQPPGSSPSSSPRPSPSPSPSS